MTPPAVPLGEVGKSVIPGWGSFFQVTNRLTMAATKMTRVTGGRTTPTSVAKADT